VGGVQTASSALRIAAPDQDRSRQAMYSRFLTIEADISAERWALAGEAGGFTEPRFITGGD